MKMAENCAESKLKHHSSRKVAGFLKIPGRKAKGGMS
jgi:hypothetical protein